MLVLREPMRVAMALITTMVSLGAIYGLLGIARVFLAVVSVPRPMPAPARVRAKLSLARSK